MLINLTPEIQFVNTIVIIPEMETDFQTSHEIFPENFARNIL